MPILLVVNDEPTLLQRFGREFAQSGLEIVTAATAAEGLRLVAQTRPDVALFDMLLPDGTGLDAFRQLQLVDPKLPVLLMAAESASDTAIEAMKLGAFDYLLKPLDFVLVRRVIDQALEVRRLMNEPVQVAQQVGQAPDRGDVLVGRCPAMQAVYKAIGRVAPQSVTVLIRGESGTGKELVARALYQHSSRTGGPFMEVNCAAIPENLLESELFGHEKGAFTGADRRRIGKFEQCNGGTLFLDEVGDMSPVLQSKMLRVLQEQRFERVGGNETIRTDVRVIAATNRDLDQMVESGEFRRDLYYRLNGFSIHLPGLRDRGEDLLLLVDHFLARANRDLGKEVRGIAPEALDILRRHPWPGNVRELQSVIRQAVLQCTSPVLLAGSLPDVLRPATRPASLPASQSADSPQSFTLEDCWDAFVEQQLASGGGDLYDAALARMEQAVIRRVLQRVGGNQAEAARLLGVTRTTLRTKIRQLGIKIDRIVNTTSNGAALHSES